MSTSCRFCGSIDTFGSRKGVDVGRAAAGYWLYGPLGILAGTAGSEKIVVSCKSCGSSWTVDKSRKSYKAPVYTPDQKFWQIWIFLWLLTLPFGFAAGGVYGWLYLLGPWFLLPVLLYLVSLAGLPIFYICKGVTVATFITTLATLLYWSIFTTIMYDPTTGEGRSPTLSEYIVPALSLVISFTWWHIFVDKKRMRRGLF